MAADGAQVATLDVAVPRDRARSLAVIDLAADVRSWPSVEEGMRRTVEALGGLDVLVCAAGVALRGTVEQTEPGDWDELFAVNVRGVYLSVRAALPYLRAGEAPAIVIVASQLGLVASADNAAYCASKGAVIQLTRAMAIDAATEGIRVNAVCPGATRTPMTMSHYASESDHRDQDQQLIGRLIEPEEIADAIAYLAGANASAVLGSVLVVDGGYTIH